MVKSFISKRAVFSSGEQRKFILDSKRELEVSYIKMAQLLKISTRTLSDWRKEKFLMALGSVRFLSKKRNIKLPRLIEVKNPFWYVHKGAKIGGLSVYNKYGKIGGSSEYRKKRWRKWWNEEGKFKKHPIIGVSKPIKKPNFSEDLAEFVGIVMGDGGITQNQIKITLHYRDDKEYGIFVVGLIKKLFSVYVGISQRKNYSVNDYIISRTELVRFCTEKIGLKKGNKVKQQIDVPNWIKINKSYSIACVRGLIDTDGCVFDHRYRVNGRDYSYKKIVFKNFSKPLCYFVFDTLKRVGLSPRAKEKSVHIDSKKDIKKYYQLVKFHNPKHLKRYLK